MTHVTLTPIDEVPGQDFEADRQADAMKDQLRKDVASWAAARSGDAPGLATAQPPKQTPHPPPARAARPKVKAAAVAQPVLTEKKPFRMSYDGTTDRDYIAQRIKLGAR